jgi:hypothetical protein
MGVGREGVESLPAGTPNSTTSTAGARTSLLRKRQIFLVDGPEGESNVASILDLEIERIEAADHASAT